MFFCIIQRLHSGERPYKCHICGKSFSKNHHLKTHLNHHAGIKPYQCSKCNAAFSQSSNMKTHFRKCNSLSASSTVNGVNETYESTSTIVIQGPSSSESTVSNIPLIAQSPSTQLPPSDMSDMLLEEQLQQQQRRRQMQHEQFAGLSLSQQQQLLDEIGNNHVLGFPQLASIPSPLSSPTSSRGVAYRTNNHVNSSQGFRSMSSSNSNGRSAISIITSGNPSPTSLAAGHPFIPLNALENPSFIQPMSPHLSSSAPPPPSTYIPPRRPSALGQLSPSDLSTAQQRSARSRIIQQSQGAQQQSNFNMLQTDIHSLSRMRLQLSPTDIPFEQISPRQSQMSQNIPNYYEVLLPALSISRPGGASHSQNHYLPQFSPTQQQMVRNEMLEVPVPQHSLTRPQDLQRIYRVQNPRNNTAR
jgi:DNA-directed RNA polymerase subunit RPC12/RpoP